MERMVAGDVGRLAPKRNVQAAGKRWALGCWPAKPETKMPPAENVHLVFSRLKNSRLLFFVCQLNFVLLLSAAGAASPGKTKQKR